jgi:hypothetical protein
MSRTLPDSSGGVKEYSGSTAGLAGRPILSTAAAKPLKGADFLHRKGALLPVDCWPILSTARPILSTGMADFLHRNGRFSPPQTRHHLVSSPFFAPEHEEHLEHTNISSM